MGRFCQTSRVAVDRLSVMKWMPGTPSASSRSHSRLACSMPSRRKVLVVDDEPDFAQLVKEYLSLKGGLEVEIAESGFQAGFTVARFKPDLILMDLMMPNMDGFEAHRMLRADPEMRHVPVIACTAYRDPDVDRRLREQPFDGFIQKPLELEALLQLVRGHLQELEQAG